MPINMFECVILAGGFGTRLKSVSKNIPKPMMPVGEQPFLYMLMKNLEKYGCSNIVLSLHYKSDYIKEKIIQDNPVKCNVNFVIEPEPLGTGGAIKYACSKIDDERFIVLNGDTYQNLDYLDFYNSSSCSDLLISAVKIDNNCRYGSITIDSNMNVISIDSGTSSNLINSGTYSLKRSDIKGFKEDVFSFENDFLVNFQGNFKAYVNENIFIDIGVPEDYFRANELLK